MLGNGVKWLPTQEWMGPSPFWWSVTLSPWAAFRVEIPELHFRVQIPYLSRLTSL